MGSWHSTSFVVDINLLLIGSCLKSETCPARDPPAPAHQVIYEQIGGKICCLRSASLLSEMSFFCYSALCEIRIEILERFFFIIWLLARCQLSLKSTLSDISIEQH